MTARRIPPPGNPTAAQVATADQNHAATRSTLDKLISDARTHVLHNGYDPNDVGVWINVAMSGCLDAALDLTPEDDDDPCSALAGLLGEAVLRLAQSEVPG